MTLPNPQAMVAQMLADPASSSLDDAAFRQRTARTAQRLLRGLNRQLAEQAAARKRTAATSAARYRFVAVPSSCRSASVLIGRAELDRLVHVLGSPQAVDSLARKVAPGYRPESGMTRSAYVRRRLQHHIARCTIANQLALRGPMTKNGS